MTAYIETHKPLRRSGKTGADDMRKLDGVLQNLGLAPKPHPSIFFESPPEVVFDGLE